MKKLILFVPIILAFACGERNAEPHTDVSNEPLIQIKPEWGKYFDAYGVEGCFLLHELNANTWTVYNKPRADSAFLPASTFKVFNTMIVLDAGTISDTETKIPWDGVERWSKAWNQDLNLREAMQYSAAWVYQELVRRMDSGEFQHYLDTMNYGNRDTGGPPDMAWLTGGLRITAKEQIDLLVKLYKNELPFTRKSMDTVREIMTQEKTDTYHYRFKTGWGGMPGPEVGWLIGWVEREEEIYFFAMNIRIRKNEDAEARKAITRDLFEDRGILEKQSSD